jgi:hypothetical protein
VTTVALDVLRVWLQTLFLGDDAQHTYPSFWMMHLGGQAINRTYYVQQCSADAGTNACSGLKLDEWLNDFQTEPVPGTLAEPGAPTC